MGKSSQVESKYLPLFKGGGFCNTFTGIASTEDHSAILMAGMWCESLISLVYYPTILDYLSITAKQGQLTAAEPFNQIIIILKQFVIYIRF